MRHLYLLIGLFSCCLPWNVEAQTDTLQLPEITVLDSMVQAAIAQDALSKEAANRLAGHSIAQVLQREAGWFVRSYGLGSLATPSIQGGSAAQVQVLWNGVSVNSPMLALQDWSLLKLGQGQQVQWQAGGSSSSNGSGAISGAVGISDEAPAIGWLSAVRHTVGSFGQQAQLYYLGFGKGRIRTQVQWHRERAVNDFPYQTASGELKRQSNAQLRHDALQASLFARLGTKHRVSAHFWQLASHRQLPPLAAQTRSLANQSDDVLRATAQWQWQLTRGVLHQQLAFLKEGIDYRDPQILLSAQSGFTTLLAKTQWKHAWKNGVRSALGVEWSSSRADAPNYSEPQTQRNVQTWLQYQRPFGAQHDVELGGRLAITSDLAPAWAAHWAWDYRWSQRYHVRLEASHDFRLPGMNDRFWVPGGNPALKPETAWSQRLVIVRVQKSEQPFAYKIQLFNRFVNDWIQWTQQEGSSLFSASNIPKVWSRGVQTTASWRLGKIELEAAYQLAASTYQVSIRQPAIDKGEQLWYTPRHQAQGTVAYTFRNGTLAYHHTWRDASTGINAPVAAYHLGDVEAEYHFRTMGLYLSCTNVWGAEYRVIENRRMPRQAFELGLKLTFSRQQDQN